MMFRHPVASNHADLKIGELVQWRALKNASGPVSSPPRLTGFTLRSLPLTLAETLERFSSSLLPPSFAPGRSATHLFATAGAAFCGVGRFPLIGALRPAR